MAGLGDDAENAALDHALSVSAWTMPTAIYVSLHTADPSGTGASEVTGGTYGRQGDTAFSAAASGASDNDSDIVFTLMPAATVTHVGLWDAASSGNFLWEGALGAPKDTNAGDTFTIAAGDLDVSID